MFISNRSPRTRRTALTAAAATVLVLVTVSGAAAPAKAEIVRMVVDKREAVTDPGARAAGPYELIRGRLFGEVDPKRPQNAIIQDIGAAPTNGRGKVEYISTFTLLRPTDPAKRAGVLLASVPNRGHRDIPSWRASGLTDPAYYERGYAVLYVGWQADLAELPDADHPAGNTESMRAPRATGAGGQPITGRYLMRVPNGGGQGPSGAIMRLDQGGAGALVYMPATFDTHDAVLTGGPAEDIDGKRTGARYTISPADWTWWDCKTQAAPTASSRPGDLCVKRIAGAFAPDESYLRVFSARDPLVNGLGLAAMRDAVSFFRYETADATGAANPLAGEVRHVVGQGQSQVGNFVKTFIALGFNADERGRRVWDGANAHIAGRRIPLNYRFSTPGSSPSLYMPGSEGVLWWGAAKDPLHGGPPRSLLDRCRANDTCPKIFETFGGAELWNQRMTPGLVGFGLGSDIPLPANVRRYYFPGTQHGGGAGSFALNYPASVCTLPINPNPEADQMRALTVALVDWVAENKAPPASAYPTLQHGDLVRDRAAAYRFPKLPGVAAAPFGLANPVLVYDFGPEFDYADMSGVITEQPPVIRGRVPALVAQVDADGNEQSGAPSVQHMAPLGAYLSWNTYREGPFAGQICSFNGGFIPFARTAKERAAANDPRPSIEERYHTRHGYVAAVEAAAAKAEREGFLLKADGERIVQEAQHATETGDLSFLAP
jgi:hypothetical protein